MNLPTTREDFPFPLHERTPIFVDNPMQLLGLIETIGAWLIANQSGHATVFGHGSFNFVQLLIQSDGALYVESSKAGDLARDGDAVWKVTVEEIDFLGGRALEAAEGQERMAAELLTRAMLDLHELKLPSKMDVFVSDEKIGA